MDVDIKNGASVTRSYGDGSGELLAIFQYMHHAEEYALKIAQEDEVASMGSFLIATCLYTGKAKMFAPHLKQQ